MDAARFAQLLAYCRLDAEELSEADKVLLEGMYDSAVSYMTQAGVPVPESGTPRRAQYDQVVNSLVLSTWEQRGSQSEGIDLTENPVFRRQLVQLKLTAQA